MATIQIGSPVGTLIIREDRGQIVRLTWGRADVVERTDLLAEAARQVRAYFDGELRTFDLPLAPPGSPFQQGVYRAMSAIPYGETRSYGDIARDLGSVARAVGQACGANPIPILIPCHRVLGAGGTIGGFSGGRGTPTKRSLLAHEGALSLSLDL